MQTFAQENCLICINFKQANEINRNFANEKEYNLQLNIR